VQNSSFNPKPEAMAGATCGRSNPLPAIASGFGLNEDASAASAASWALGFYRIRSFGWYTISSGRRNGILQSAPTLTPANPRNGSCAVQ